MTGEWLTVAVWAWRGYAAVGVLLYSGGAPHLESVRLDVRLDGERRRKLKALAVTRGVAVSQVVRELIDHAYEDVQQQTRQRAATALCELEVSDVPDPPALERRLDAAYDIPDPYRR